LKARKHLGFIKNSSPVVVLKKTNQQRKREVYQMYRISDMGLKMSLPKDNLNYIRHEGHSESNLQ
jgi:hypothetical protein